MKYILTIGLFLVVFSTKSQNLFPEKFNNCRVESFTVENKTIRAKADCRDLYNAIVMNLDSTILKNLEGDVFVQILVDPRGRPCTLSLKSNLNISYKQLKINKIINKKTTWEPLAQDSTTTMFPEIKSTAVVLRIEFAKEYILLQRLGGYYEADNDWAELDRYAGKRTNGPVLTPASSGH